MRAIAPIFLGIVLFFGTAHADIWKWVDANGGAHYVDSQTPIYTWTDQDGKVYFSDTPEHANAVSVQLVWHSSGSLEDVPNETEEERLEREEVEAYNCKRATEIYDSYKSAPRLYRSDDNGEREYLSRTESRKTIREARQQKEELCP